MCVRSEQVNNVMPVKYATGTIGLYGSYGLEGIGHKILEGDLSVFGTISFARIHYL